jgi:hypothetical protein
MYTTQNGVYWIRAFDETFQVYCELAGEEGQGDCRSARRFEFGLRWGCAGDMVTDGGGWTYVARGSDAGNTNDAVGAVSLNPATVTSWHLSARAILGKGPRLRGAQAGVA